MSDLRKAAEMALDALHNIDQSNNYDAIEALRQALAQPEWVGLTEEEFFDLLSSKTRYNNVEIHLIADVIRATQAKLKEKNGG
jgi:hypothetical protein